MNATATAQVATAAQTDRHPCACSTVIAFAENGEPQITFCKATTKRIFAPGHDARLKGFLIRAGAKGLLVTFAGSGLNTDAQAMANGFGFGGMVAAGIAAAKDRQMAKLIRDTKKQAKKTHETPKTVTCKVGRWEYQGVITDSPTEGPQFTYTSAKGVQTTTTRFRKI